MTKTQFAIIIILAAALGAVFGIAIYETAERRAELAETYSLLYEDPTGASSIEDFNLTLRDCFEAVQAMQPSRGWSCELER